MTISQVKIDLAVLHKLFEMVEMDYGSGSPEEIVGLFEIPLSAGRVEIALKELQKSQDVELDPENEGSWQITREGVGRVEKSLRIPTTFLARLHTKGDIWLDSSEAQSAVIARRTDKLGSLSESVVFSQRELVTQEAAGINWNKFGAIASVLAIPVAVIIWWFS